MVLCLFQGTFNPIHNAHLRVAEYVVNHCEVDKVVFVPAFIPPHKNYDSETALHRLNMVSLAVGNNKNFCVSDMEFKLGGKSYTYRTIREFYKNFNPNDKFKFIIGTDAFRKIETWYEADKLKEQLHFLVFLRDNNFIETEFDYLKLKGYDFEFMPLKFEDISSSFIRQTVKTGGNLTEFVPKQVEEYIKENDLYKY